MMCGKRSQWRNKIIKEIQEAQHITSSINTLMLHIIFKLLKTKDIKKILKADWGRSSTLCRGKKWLLTSHQKLFKPANSEMTSLNGWGIKVTLKFCIQQKYPSKIEDEMENIFSFVLFFKGRSICHQQTCTTRNVKGYWGWGEMILN